MRSARNQLILLGFICQGLTWDDYLLPLANTLLWVVCLTVLQGRIRLSAGVEGLVMIGGCLAGLLLGRLFGHDTHYFVGHGLTLIQAARLLRPLGRREQVYSLIMACFQLGVGCTFLFDLRFIPVFLGMAVLLPRAFVEVESGSFAAKTATAAPVRTGLKFKYVAAIFGIAVAFFLAFPRGAFGGAARFLGGSTADSTSLLDAVVDPTRSAAAQSRRVLLQIQGEKLGYLRCYSLSEFDGLRWTAAPPSEVWPIRPAPPEDESRCLTRRVNVKQIAYLGSILPTDGRVVHVSGRFFRGPMRNAQDAIQCEAMRNTANNIYEYTIDPSPNTQPLAEPVRRQMTRYPSQSPRLRSWLDGIVAGETNPQKIARRLEAFLQQNFKYSLGAPELSRLAPVDDFVFNQKQGHCERFASTLALLLRMKNIPSRVVIGYLPRSRGGMDGWYSVRFNDAHAWTEAWLEGIGWLRLDATPAASMPDTGSFLRDWWDTLDLAWNLHVVNFDGAGQRYLLGASIQTAMRMAGWLRESRLLWFAFVGVLALGGVYWMWRSRKRFSTSPARARQQAMRVAGNYYGQMLRALGKQGFRRREQQTPLEFLDLLTAAARPWLPDARLITEAFCETRYGHQILTPARQAEIERALQSIKRGNARPAREKR